MILFGWLGGCSAAIFSLGTLDSLCTLFNEMAEHPFELLSQQQGVQQTLLGLEKILRSLGTRPERNHSL